MRASARVRACVRVRAHGLCLGLYYYYYYFPTIYYYYYYRHLQQSYHIPAYSRIFPHQRMYSRLPSFLCSDTAMREYLATRKTTEISPRYFLPPTSNYPRHPPGNSPGPARIAGGVSYVGSPPRRSGGGGWGCRDGPRRLGVPPAAPISPPLRPHRGRCRRVVDLVGVGITLPVLGQHGHELRWLPDPCVRG